MDRTGRISGEMQKEISDIIRNEIKDPRLPELVSVTAVRVTKDLSYAKVYISVFGTKEQKDDTIKALKHASGFIRHGISHRMNLRHTPELSFLLDDSIEQGFHISHLIDETMNHNKPEQ